MNTNYKQLYIKNKNDYIKLNQEGGSEIKLLLYNSNFFENQIEFIKKGESDKKKPDKFILDFKTNIGENKTIPNIDNLDKFFGGNTLSITSNLEMAVKNGFYIMIKKAILKFKKFRDFVFRVLRRMFKKENNQIINEMTNIDVIKKDVADHDKLQNLLKTINDNNKEDIKIINSYLKTNKVFNENNFKEFDFKSKSNKIETIEKVNVEEKVRNILKKLYENGFKYDSILILDVPKLSKNNKFLFAKLIDKSFSDNIKIDINNVMERDISEIKNDPEIIKELEEAKKEIKENEGISETDIKNIENENNLEQTGGDDVEALGYLLLFVFCFFLFFFTVCLAVYGGHSYYTSSRRIIYSYTIDCNKPENQRKSECIK